MATVVRFGCNDCTVLSCILSYAALRWRASREEPDPPLGMADESEVGYTVHQVHDEAKANKALYQTRCR